MVWYEKIMLPSVSRDLFSRIVFCFGMLFCIRYFWRFLHSESLVERLKLEWPEIMILYWFWFCCVFRGFLVISWRSFLLRGRVFSFSPVRIM